MDSTELNSNQKRQRENEKPTRPPQRKSPRLLAKIQSSMKITGLNDDCLEKIFDHLDLASLFNVAVANEWLRPAAGIVYKRRFGDNLVALLAAGNVREPFERNDMKQVSGLKTCLQYLRCFGSSISKAHIEYEDLSSEQCQFIHQYINEYCAASLEVIGLKNKSGAHNLHFEKPFVNVHSVVVLCSDLGNQLASFPEWFPNVRGLTLINVQMDECLIGMPFTQLVYFCVDFYDGDLGKGFKEKNVSQLLRLSHQLIFLDIRTLFHQVMTMTALLNMIKHNQMIRQLVVSMDKLFWLVNPSEMQQLVDEHPSLHELDLPNCKFTADTAIALVRQLNSLTKFRFQLDSTPDYGRFVAELDGLGQWQHSLFVDLNNNHIVTMSR